MKPKKRYPLLKSVKLAQHISFDTAIAKRAFTIFIKALELSVSQTYEIQQVYTACDEKGLDAQRVSSFLEDLDKKEYMENCARYEWAGLNDYDPEDLEEKD